MAVHFDWQVTWTELVQHGLSASLLLPRTRSPISDCHLSCIALLMDFHGEMLIPSSFLLLTGVATQVGSQACKHLSGVTRGVTAGVRAGVRDGAISEVTGRAMGGSQVRSQVGSQVGSSLRSHK